MAGDLARTEALTPAEWQRLPWLLPVGEVIRWTGLSRDDLDALVRLGRLSILRTRRKRKFYKAEVAALIRVPGQSQHEIVSN